MTASVPAPVPVVITGCGAITRCFYVPALRYLESFGHVRVVALCDPDPVNLAAAAAEFPSARAVERLGDAPLLREQTLVIVASPPQHHAAQAIFALERGCAVLSEKPMAASLADAERMAAAAARTRCPLAIGLYRRFFRATQTIRELVQHRTLGPILSFNVEEGGPFRWEAASESFFRREATPGGVLYDTGVHTLDLLLWWFGEPSDFDYRDDAAGGLEANARLSLRYGAGFTGEVRLSRDWHTRNRYRFRFAHGTVTWDVAHAGRLSVTLDRAPFTLQGELVPHTGAGLGEGSPQAFIRQLLDVVEAVHTGSPVQVGGPEGLRSLRLIEACYRARQPLVQAWLSPEEASGLAHLAPAEASA